MKWIAVLLLSAVLAGCATQKPEPIASPSGKPDVTILANPDRIRSAVLDHYINAGFVIVKNDASVIVIERADQSLGASIIYGSRYDPTPYRRVRFNFIAQGDGRTRVISEWFMVGNRGSAFEHEDAMRPDVGAHRMLLKIKADLEGTAAASPDGAPAPQASPVTAAAYAPAPPPRPAGSTIRLGMTPAEVKAAKGEPSRTFVRISSKEDQEEWIYANGDKVTIDHGKVSAYEGGK